MPAPREVCVAQNKHLDVFIDLNMGERTGILPGRLSSCLGLSGNCLGLFKSGGPHAYDGPIHDTDIAAKHPAFQRRLLRPWADAGG